MDEMIDVNEKLRFDIKQTIGLALRSIDVSVDKNIDDWDDKVVDIIREVSLDPVHIKYDRDVGLLHLNLNAEFHNKVSALEKALDVQQENYLKLSAQYGVLEKERNNYRDMVDRMHNAIHAVGAFAANWLDYDKTTTLLEDCTTFRNEFWEIQRVNRNEGRPFYTYLDGELVLVKAV